MGTHPVGGLRVERPAGTHPTALEAAQIALDSAAPEHPGATLADTFADLYPLPNQRSTYAARVVTNSKTQGFKMPLGKVPTGDTNTLGDVSTAVQTNASA